MISQQLATAKDMVRVQEGVLVKDCIDFVEKSTGKEYKARRAGVVRQGNWCGHDPDSPRFFQKPESHKARPKIITWAIDAWQRFYCLPNSYFKDIRMRRNSTRQQRSEAREALASISQVLLHYTELASLRVGVPHASEGFRSLTIEFLADKAGIGLKRAQRAIKLLVRAGYLKMIERFDVTEKEGKERFIGLAAVKCLTPAFFKACNINLQALSAQRGLARKRLNKKRSTFIANAQESQAAVRNIIDFIAPQGNAKTHINTMKGLLKGEQKMSEQLREKERKRRDSLGRQYNPQE
ncbi:hypothetical protein TUM19329_35410 (plasmid) [Legionella antarctica]|uniref:Uncharacterized protein n=2 Tax=Legionella antarctica TaxID=2708020 RepID=A0A6F8TAI9_9GAMM|nr:hypothetical protein TUM19329_35410 [Legionella antarctica]